MAVYACTMRMAQATWGWSETWISLDWDLKMLCNEFGQLMQARSACMWSNQTFTSARISELDPARFGIPAKRYSIRVPPGEQQIPAGLLTQAITVPTVGPFNPTGKTTRPDQVRSVIQNRVFFDDRRYKTRYFSGAADAVTGTDAGGIDITGYPAWQTAFQSFLTEVESKGWRIKARTSLAVDPEQDIQSWTVQAAAPSLAGIVVAPGGPVYVATDRLQIQKITTKEPTAKRLSGTYRVDSINTTLMPPNIIYYLRGTAGVDVSNIKKLGTVRKVNFALFDVQHVVPSGIGIKKRGRVEGLSAGRRKTRVSVDP